MKKLLLFLLVTISLFAQAKEQQIEAENPSSSSSGRTWTIAVGPFIPYAGFSFSKDFGNSDSEEGISTTSKVSFDFDQDISIESKTYNLNSFSLEQTLNYDFYFTFFHLQPYLGFGYTFGNQSLNGVSNFKSYPHLALGLNLITAKVLVISFQTRTMLVSGSQTSTTSSLKFGYRF